MYLSLSHHLNLAPLPKATSWPSFPLLWGGSMPGGITPKRQNASLFKEITLREPVNGEKSWSWVCNHCQVKFSWSSTKRVRLHLAKQGKLIAHCNSVTEEVQQREGACVKANVTAKRKRESDVKAAQEASQARQAVHAI